ncbi:hypothetical protein FisN_28Lh083 [Fistulifera solaris]|jgi:hypothetical protein|uniref:Uncharacterized protein n=1 Tax=Fistulifera solaris TaxID=1519565 RepID=A0A1Z5K5N1_FISSO|nr:hypothetical protein FisN_28Lh083 [Fistulifera solaris]|eukprot:GAX21391.1 hypothetical protein FisN_28Lh083 [Fistulifera solaris]
MKFFSIALAALISQATAAPDGASACPAGAAAPGGSHLDNMPGLVGGLSKGNYVVSVGGSPVVLDGTPIEVPLDFDIQVTADGTEFKGILIRVGGASVDQVTSADLTAPAGACGDVGSVTHSDNSPKTVGTASVSLDAAATLDVDISVVLENEDNVSTFYYSAFQINAVDDSTPSETDAPVEEETDAPIGEETDAPNGEGTEAPASTPVEETPVDTPTSSAMAIGCAAGTLAGALAFLF